MKRKLKGIIRTVLTALLTASMVLSLPTSVRAADQTQHGSEGIVQYEHDGLPESQKRVTTWTGGGDYWPADGSMYTSGNNPTNPYQYVYCINQSLSATSKERWNANFRWRWNATANKWLLDNSKSNLTNPENSRGSGAYDDLVKILYAGYPYNGAGLNPAPNYGDTQRAVFKAFQGSYSGFDGTEEGANRIMEAAQGLTLPSHTMYIYLPDSDAKQSIQNTIGLTVWETQPDNPPEIKNTTAKINDTTGSVELSSGEEGTMIDEVTCEGLAEGKTYVVKSYIYKDKELFAESVGVEVTSTTEFPVTVEFDKGITEAGTYSIKTELILDGEKLLTHNDDLGVTDETVTVTISEPTKRSLGTTVKGASSKTPLELKAGEDGTITTDVVDTIQYKNLTGGASYRVSGTLIEKETGETIKTSEESKTADASGNGEWEVIFSGVTLEAGKSYVVLEKAVNEADENDWAEHNNRDDKAQTVVVKETEPGEVTIQISKQDLGGTELEGAEMTVTGADDYSTSWTSDGSAKELSLLPGEYQLKETVAPDGYKQITTTISFEVDEAGKVTLKEATVDNGGKVEVMDENHIVLKDAPEDEPDEPTDPDDDEPDKPTDPDDDEPDKPTEPDEDEPEEPDNSTPTVNIQKVLHYTVNVGGSKYWNDNNNEAQARPESITMTLYGDGEAIESKTVTGAGDTWVFDFGERDMYKAGEPINYTVVETDVEYYESSVTAAYDKVQDETGSTLRFAVTNDYTGPSPDQLGAGRRGDRLGAARNTGDESSMLLWLCVMLAASAGLIIVTKISHNKKK